LFIGQNRTEAVLRAHLEKHGYQVEWNTELRGFEQHSDRVTAHMIKSPGSEETSENIDCHWLVGADGGKSAVRKQLGFKFLGEALAEPMVNGEIEVKAGLDQAVRMALS